MYTVYYLSDMIPYNGRPSSVNTKVNKPFAWWICILLGFAPRLSAQNPGTAVFDAPGNEIFLLSARDTVASVPLDASFRAVLNHEKKKKKRTVYYRLSAYDRPADIISVPVFIGGRGDGLVLAGVLRGDVPARFRLSFGSENGQTVMEMQVPDISVNTFCFEWKTRKSEAPHIRSLDENTSCTVRKKSKNVYRVTLHGNIYRLGLDW